MYSPSGQQTVKKRVVPKNNNILSNSNTSHNRSGSKGKTVQATNKVSELYEQLTTKPSNIEEQELNKSFLGNRPDRPQTR